MCGIAGVCLPKNRVVDEAVLLRMRDSLSHRGPDDAGIFISLDKRTGLAHRRLSIIDLSSAGHQPMANENEIIWITFNGEIYNFNEIRKELLEKGHVFKSNTDTEVVIHSYEEHGISCLEHFNGMFAFVIFDVKKNLLFLARDRFGIKPLHYGYLSDGSFVFASEIKAIVAHPAFRKSISYEALGEYFKYRYVPSPRTIWRNVLKLSHGHYGIYDINRSKLHIEKYYSLIEKTENKRKSSLDEVKSNLCKAISSRLVSDVELGCLLSGGIDSSVVTALASKEQPYIKSFSIGFVPNEYSELPYADLVAEYLHTNHITKVIENTDKNIVDALAYSYDEPIADSSCIPTYILCKMVADNVKVALSGDAGDEVFSGYNWYKRHLDDYTTFNSGIISMIRTFFGHRNRFITNFEDYYNKLLLNRFNNHKLKKLLSPSVYAEFTKEHDNLFDKYKINPYRNVRALQFIDMNTFMVDDILAKVDRASMAFSLEVRVPFLDHRLVESTFLLDEIDFPSTSINKPVLKKLMKNNLPRETLFRSKKGFSAPVTKWGYYENLSDKVLNGYALKHGLFNREFIIELKENVYPNSTAMLWMIFVFEKWYQRWFL